jgi:signal transduction histidine kinase
VLATGTLVILLSAWTVLIATTPVVGFGVGWPRFLVSPESVGMVASVLTAFLVYLRYSVSGSDRFLFIALAFIVLAFSQLILGVSISEGSGAVPQQEVYLWTAGRVLAAVLLFMGATKSARGEKDVRESARTFLVATAAVLAVTAAVDAGIWAVGDRLPSLSTATAEVARQSSGILPGLTLPGLVMGSLGSALYLTAAAMYLRPLDRPPAESLWLAPGLVIAGFSHLHYMLFPVILTDRLSTGDLLRILFAAVLLAGVAWELRRTVLSERFRASELQALYAGEQVRVRELEEIDRTKAELFRVLTHELAHPVATLRGFVMSLSSRWDELDDGTKLRTLRRMDDESKRLRDLAEEVVSVSQLDAPGFSVALREERVTDLLREASAFAGSVDARVRTETDDPVRSAMVVVDRARMMQVFRNLVSNAVKFSPDVASVEIDARLDGAEVVFSVTDQGSGIPSEDIPRLFHQFTRLHRAGEEEIAGSGLGLYISRRIVEAHQGRIWVESEVGAGSVFNVALPLAQEGA